MVRGSTRNVSSSSATSLVVSAFVTVEGGRDLGEHLRQIDFRILHHDKDPLRSLNIAPKKNPAQRWLRPIADGALKDLR